MILKLKRGYLHPQEFRDKFGVDIIEHWKDVWADYQQRDWATVANDEIRLTVEGLLRVDGMLPPFFEAEHQGVRYT